MSWIEIAFETPEAQAQIYSNRLEAMGAVSVSFYDAGVIPILEPLPGTTPLWDMVKVVGLFSEDCDSEKITRTLQQWLPDTVIQCQALEEQDWSRTWLAHFKPIQFGTKLWVIPSDSPLPEQDDAVVVKLDPGLAFGTGTHATTALCLRWLDANPPLSQTIIDYGCGSGILAIAGLKLGASQAIAIDYDPQALSATQENRLRNDIEAQKLSVMLPEEQTQMMQADTLLANILAEPLISLNEKLTSLLKSGGNLVMSGLLTKQIEAVSKAYEPWFTLQEIQTQEEWALIWLVKN